MSEFRRFQVGDTEVVILSDGITAFSSELLAVGVPEAERVEACRRWDLDPISVASSINCVYMHRDGHRILFDTGAGSTLPGCGSLPDSLDAAGIDPESIDQVIHTHLHLDHVGWNLDKDGAPMFPNARYCIGATEYAFWADESTHEALERCELWKLPDFEPAMSATVKRYVLTLEDQIDVIADDSEPASGVRSIPSFGHTPGHLAFRVDLGTDELFITGDLVLSPFHLDHADWYPAVDLAPKTAMASRSDVLNEAATAGALVAGYHLRFPGIGRVSSHDNGWTWSPVTTLEE